MEFLQTGTPLKRAQIHVFWPPRIHIFFISQKVLLIQENDIISQKCSPLGLIYSLQNENTLKIEQLMEFLQTGTPLKRAQIHVFWPPRIHIFFISQKVLLIQENDIISQKCSPLGLIYSLQNENNLKIEQLMEFLQTGTPLKRAQIHTFWPPRIHIFFISQKVLLIQENDIISQKCSPLGLIYSLQNENNLKIEQLMEFLQTGTPLKRAQIHTFWPPRIHIFFISQKVLLIQAKRYHIPKVQSFRLQIQFTE